MHAIDFFKFFLNSANSFSKFLLPFAILAVESSQGKPALPVKL